MATYYMRCIINENSKSRRINPPQQQVDFTEFTDDADRPRTQSRLRHPNKCRPLEWAACLKSSRQ